MQSVDLSVTIINANDCSMSSIRNINMLEVPHVTINRIAWIPSNSYVLINNTMRERLGLDICKTLSPARLSPALNTIVSSRDQYPVCEPVYLVNPSTGKFADIAYPTLVHDLPVDFVLGTIFFESFDRGFKSGRVVIISEEEAREKERKEEEARRQTYRNIL